MRSDALKTAEFDESMGVTVENIPCGSCSWSSPLDCTQIRGVCWRRGLWEREENGQPSACDMEKAVEVRTAPCRLR